MKKVLIISPHFPPVNAADMQRVRHSLPYFKQNGWIAEVIAVDPDYVESYSLDMLLNETIPADIRVHRIKALDYTKTRPFGLGSISMRSFFEYKKLGNQLLESGEFDLVYFSTTAFHVMALGRYWKEKFGVPFILDMQDPWRNDFYLDKPKKERPPKFFMAYNIDKYLERYTMKKVDGIISVSQGYVDTLLKRYPYLSEQQFTVIPFGFSKLDYRIMADNIDKSGIGLQPGKINIVYVGRGGHDMKLATSCFFEALKNVSETNPGLKEKLHCWFIGTSYAPEGKGKKTLSTIADKIGVGELVTEITDRVPFFETLFLLKEADALFIPGSTDKSYTASKIYQYVLAERPMLAIFYEGSSVISILKKAETGTVVTFNDSLQYTKKMIDTCEAFIRRILADDTKHVTYNKIAFEEYSAETMTRKQAEFFDKIIA